MYLMKDSRPDPLKFIKNTPYLSDPNLVLTTTAWPVLCQTYIILTVVQLK
jgi:hypothetical protein